MYAPMVKILVVVVIGPSSSVERYNPDFGGFPLSRLVSNLTFPTPYLWKLMWQISVFRFHLSHAILAGICFHAFSSLRCVL